MSQKRVVITGMGAISSLGLGVERLWEGLIAGRSGIGHITHPDADDFLVKIAAEVTDFDPREYMDVKIVDRTLRFSQFAIAASKMAVEQAGLDISREMPQRVGVITSSTVDIGYIAKQGEVLRNKGPKRIDPLFITKQGPHMASAQVGMFLGAKGPNSSLYSACASGNDALGVALNYIRLGYADVMLAGGTDASISPVIIAGMGLLGALSREMDPTRASRPFDLNRSGFVYGEGVGMLMLESYEHAMRRGAPILAELAGAGWSFDAYSETAPDAEMEAVAMSVALQDAGVIPEEVDYINAHGTSTKLNDAGETRAIKAVFGDSVYRIPISANKSMIGHTIAAAGALEAIATVKTINEGIIPPTINYETPDPECDLDYVPNIARRANVGVALSNAFGFGGQNCCLVIRRFTD